jgi:hypothetical protein
MHVPHQSNPFPFPRDLSLTHFAHTSLDHERIGSPLVKATNLHYGTLSLLSKLGFPMYHNVDLWL